MLDRIDVILLATGIAGLIVGWVPLYVYLWLVDRGRIGGDNLAGGFGPCAYCITPPALLLIAIGGILFVARVIKARLK